MEKTTTDLAQRWRFILNCRKRAAEKATLVALRTLGSLILYGHQCSCAFYLVCLWTVNVVQQIKDRRRTTIYGEKTGWGVSINYPVARLQYTPLGVHVHLPSVSPFTKSNNRWYSCCAVFTGWRRKPWFQSVQKVDWKIHSNWVPVGFRRLNIKSFMVKDVDLPFAKKGDVVCFWQTFGILHARWLNCTGSRACILHVRHAGSEQSLARNWETH